MGCCTARYSFDYMSTTAAVDYRKLSHV